MIRRRIQTLLSRFRGEIRVYQRAVRDPRTPWLARMLLGAAVAYALSPVDLIPDFIPVIGHIDDLLVVPLLVWLATRMIPIQVIIDARSALRNGRPSNQTMQPIVHSRPLRGRLSTTADRHRYVAKRS